ncbi:MAG: thioredoxin domain-containing protein [Chitinophagaceae bacterium]
MHTNKLIDETSPYLLQHAHNPVNWFPWGEEALSKAKEENKPILVSIGYAACHWCHVMEKESFENETTAALMNEKFINIKIDREERPDLDHIYMDAVQAMTGSGGWPLNVFLTPEGKPFYGGTYYPPVKAFNRASWTETLQGITQAFNERRHEIDAQAENLTQHLSQANSFGLQQSESNEVFTWEKMDEAYEQIMKAADTEEGGFGNAPKFPQTFTIQFLLRYSHAKKIQSQSEGPKAPSVGGGLGEAQALFSLDKMISGGIYDQLGGGFARYSTDAEWLAPHFEKMLYDNALLLMVLSEAYQLTGKERYKEVIEETISFVERELLHPSKGFYAALDADSEGVEGKFYIWQKIEVENILNSSPNGLTTNDVSLFCQYYDITNQGNWEGENIMRVKQSIDEFALKNNISIKELKALLDRGKLALMKHRDQRIRPLLDDKIILGWNALMNTACSKSFEATGNEGYRQLAIENMKFLLEKFKNRSGEFYHTWKNDKAKYPAFLDDYAFLLQALIRLSEITTDTKWLIEAKEIAGYVLEHFSEEGTGFFYFTNDHQQDVILRKKEVYDGAVPSGNAIMAYVLYHLSIFFNIREWRERSNKMLTSLGKSATRYPTSFGIWNSLILEIVAGTQEIAIVGKNAAEIHTILLKEFVPHRVIMASFHGDPAFPLLEGKDSTSPASIYLCKNFACLKPVNTVKDLMSLIDNGSRNI